MWGVVTPEKAMARKIQVLYMNATVASVLKLVNNELRGNTRYGK